MRDEDYTYLRVYWLFIQYQMSSHKILDTNNMIQTEQVLLKNIYAFMYMYLQIITILEKNKSYI